jgi:hypothetical protein
MRVSASFTFTFAALLLCVSGITPSVAETVNCKMYSCVATGYNYPCSVISTNSYTTTWEAKRVPKEQFEIDASLFKAIPGQMSAKAKITEDGVIKTLVLLPSKTLTMRYNLGQVEADVFARYRCDTGSAEVLSTVGKRLNKVSPAPSTPTSSSTSKLDKAKFICTELGFTAGTEKHGECVLKMIDK